MQLLLDLASAEKMTSKACVERERNLLCNAYLCDVKFMIASSHQQSILRSCCGHTVTKNERLDTDPRVFWSAAGTELHPVSTQHTHPVTYGTPEDR